MDKPDYNNYKNDAKDKYKYTRNDDFKYDYKSGIKWFNADKYGNRYRC